MLWSGYNIFEIFVRENVKRLVSKYSVFDFTCFILKIIKIINVWKEKRFFGEIVSNTRVGFCYKQREALHLYVSNSFNVSENFNFLFSCFWATKTSLEKINRNMPKCRVWWKCRVWRKCRVRLKCRVQRIYPQNGPIRAKMGRFAPSFL